MTFRLQSVCRTWSPQGICHMDICPDTYLLQAAYIYVAVKITASEEENAVCWSALIDREFWWHLLNAWNKSNGALGSPRNGSSREARWDSVPLCESSFQLIYLFHGHEDQLHCLFLINPVAETQLSQGSQGEKPAVRSTAWPLMRQKHLPHEALDPPAMTRMWLMLGDLYLEAKGWKHTPPGEQTSTVPSIPDTAIQ